MAVILKQIVLETHAQACLGALVSSSKRSRFYVLLPRYAQHVDSDTQGLKEQATHTVSSPQLSLLGMTCSRTGVRVLPLRWPRRRLANAGGGNYERFSYADIGRRLQGDTDATATLQQLEQHHRATPAGAVEAAIFVQPLCGDGNIACALAAENCFLWCMGVVCGGARAQNVTMFNNASWESHVLLPDVDCGVVRDTSVREQGQCSDKNAGIIVDYRRNRCSKHYQST